MFDLFSEREVASAIYLGVFALILLTRPNGCKLFGNLLQSIFKKVFIIPVVFLLLYASLIVFGLSFVSFWKWIFVKDIIIWVLFVATPICFKAATKKTHKYPFHKMITDNFIWSTILEFVIGEISFSLLTELTVIPCFTFITVLKDHERGNPKYKNVHKFLNGIVILLGLMFLYFTIEVLLKNISQNGIIDIISSFAIPVILSIAFLPVAYILAVIGLYNDLYILVRIRNNSGDVILSQKEKRIFRACGLSYRKIQKFRRKYTADYIGVVCYAIDDDTFFDFINDFIGETTNNRSKKYDKKLIVKNKGVET